MPRRISEINVLQDYLIGVLDRAKHHAQEVGEIALAIVGAIVWKKDTEDIKVLEKEGEMKNVLWVVINGKKYAFSYNHIKKEIDIRKDTTQGVVLASFSNANTVHDVKSFFEKL